MTKWWWHLANTNEWDSRMVVASEAMPGVGIRRCADDLRAASGADEEGAGSLGRIEYFDAGRDEKNRMEASLLGAEMDNSIWPGTRRGPRTIARWCCRNAGIAGATGPEALVHEALAAIKAECGLTEPERKKLIVAFHFQFSNRAGGIATRVGKTVWKRNGAAGSAWGCARANPGWFGCETSADG